MSNSLRRLLHPAYRSLETYVHPLRYLFIEITQRCNLRCLHCGSDCGRETHFDELSTDEWLKFFAYLPKHFEPREFTLVITGGEPLCHPEFDRILAGLRDNGLQWGLVSNGYAMNQANVRKLIAHGIGGLTISLDGLRDAHDWLRGVRGSYERALKAITLAASSNVPMFDVVTCVNPRNFAELPAILDALRQAGARAWRIFTIFPRGRARDNAELRLADKDIRTLLEWIADERKKLAGTGFALNYSCEGYLPSAIDRAVRNEPYFCRAGISIGSVLCDGSISACPNISRQLIQGNIRTDDFAAVWEKRFEPFRKRDWMRQGPCASCPKWRRCQGNSLHLWDDEKRETMLCHHAILG